MRIRDLVQLGANLIESLEITWSPLDWPSVKLSGKGIWNIYENPMIASDLVSKGFVGHRVLWEDFKHEFQFKEQHQHKPILLNSLLKLNEFLREKGQQVTGHSSEDAWLRAMIDFLSSKTHYAARKVDEKPTWEEYNKWNDEIDPLGEDERMTPQEETSNLLSIVHALRKDTYGTWEALIDFLQSGPVKDDARLKLDSCRMSLSFDVDQRLTIQQRQND